MVLMAIRWGDMGCVCPPPQQHQGALSSQPSPKLWGWGRGQCPPTPPQFSPKQPCEAGGGTTRGRGRGVLGVSSAPTLLRINLFTKGKPNTFSTMDYWAGERERDETQHRADRERRETACVGGGDSKKEGWGEEQKEREREISTGGRHCGDTEHPGGLGGPTGQTD